jgi:uncharacterized protein
MPSQVAHFAINADDISRGRRFYEKVFGWKFTPYGPPGFYKIQMNGAPTALKGALQQRREIVPGVAARCFECTISVDDIDATLAAVEASGGKVVMQKCTLAGVGQLFFFQDTEGNIAGAIQFDASAE